MRASVVVLSLGLVAGCAWSSAVEPLGSASSGGPGASSSSSGRTPPPNDGGGISGGTGAGTTTGGGTGGKTPGASTGSGTGAGGSSNAGGGPPGGGATSGASSSSSGSSSSGGPTCAGGVPQPSDPRCYWEPVCPTASLADLQAGFTGQNWEPTTLAMLHRRYPSGECLLSQFQSDIGNYADPSSFAALAESMMTMCHEETHGYDYGNAGGDATFAYFFTCTDDPQLSWIEGFPRSEILPLVQGSATSLYDQTYLTGDQGTYGWTELLDEWNAYTNGMAGITLVGDYVTDTISGTDGSPALAYYVELYLRQARTQHPDVYQQIKGDAPTVAWLRTEWNRMHFFLALAAQYPNLSIAASDIEQNLYAHDNQSELEMVLGIPLTASSCN